MADNLTRDEAAQRARHLSIHSYDVDLDLTTGEETFESRTTVRFASSSNDGTFVELSAPTISSILLNGVHLDPGNVFDGYRITLPALQEENELIVKAVCAYSRTGEGLHRFVDPVDQAVYLYTQFETYDAHRMLTCFDQPDLKAPWTLTVLAPRDWVCVANTDVRSREPLVDRDSDRWTFETTPSISTYLYALVAGPYHHVHSSHDGIPLGLYCRTSLAPFLDPDELFKLTADGFDFFHEWFGVRYPFGKYDQLFVPEFNAGAMENVACVTFLEDFIFRSKVTTAQRERRAETVLHEMAHMWFGNLVTMRWWDDLWLNESFATYASVVCQVGSSEYIQGWTTFCNAEKTWALRQDQLSSTHPVVADASDMEAVKTNFDGITYAKGASLLKQLVAWVGFEEFTQGLQAYFADHAWGNTELSDLLTALEVASGRDLKAWRDEWLLTTGVNTLRPVLTTTDDGTITSFKIEQDGSPARSHRVAVGIYDRSDHGGLVRRERVELDVSGDATEVPKLIGVKRGELVIVNDDDLTFAKVRLDNDSWRSVVRSIGDIEDPLPRTLCWSAAWDMTRDGEVPFGDFLELIIGGISRESDVGVVQRLLAQTRVGILQYGNPALITQRMEALAERCWELAEASPAGGDHQLAFTLASVSSSVTDAQAARLRAILDGSLIPTGLQIDPELRWSLVVRLATIGHLDDAGIDAELKRDRTATGEKRAATARAARPVAEAKAAAWAATVETNDLSNHLAAAAMNGFAQLEQSELLRAYNKRFYAEVPEIWKSRSLDAAQQLTTLLFPSWEISEEGLALVDAALGAHPTPALRRCLMEGRDGIERALKCRAAET